MLNETFASLADPTHRAILQRLTRETEVAVGDLAKPFSRSLLDERLQTQRTTTDGPAALARAALQAYVDKDRAALAALLSGDYRFTSPIDNAIALDTYWRICWPNSEKTEGFDLVHAVEDGERAFIVYEMRANGKRFRNAEVHTARDGKLIETQVYFGWNLPHSAPLGQHGTQD